MTVAQVVPLADTWMHGGWGWGWMSLMMVLFWSAVIFGVAWLIRGVASGRSMPEAPVGTESPTEILDRRFAEGEIDEEDYRARREVLAARGEPIGRT